MTPYKPTRHPKGNQPVAQVIETDIRTECVRRGLPAPESIAVLSTAQGPRGGLTAQVTLRFSKPVSGPILLGQGSHVGDGFFRVT